MCGTALLTDARRITAHAPMESCSTWLTRRAECFFPFEQQVFAAFAFAYPRLLRRRKSTIITPNVPVHWQIGSLKGCLGRATGSNNDLTASRSIWLVR